MLHLQNRFFSLIAILLLLAVSCHAEGGCASSNEEGECINPDTTTTEELEYRPSLSAKGFASAAAIRKSLQKPSTIIVDVRTGLEVMLSGKIEVEGHKTYQSSILSMLNIDEWDKDADIIVYCASGVRSANAKQALEGMGFKNVLNGGGYYDMKSIGFGQ